MRNLPVVMPDMTALRKRHIDSLNLTQLTVTYKQTKSDSWRLLLNGKVHPLWVGFSSDLHAAMALSKVLRSRADVIDVRVIYAQ